MALIDGIDAEILANTTAVLATNGPDGRPQLSAIWFLVDGDQFVMSATAVRQKTKNVIRDQKATLFIFHPDSPNYYAEIRGDVVVADDEDYAGADRIAARYNADFRLFDAPGTKRRLLTLTPTTVNVIDVRH